MEGIVAMSKIRARLGKLLLIIGLSCLLGPVQGWAKESELKPKLEGTALISALQGGGYILYMRHATSDRLQEDTDLNNLDDCSKQRNLSGQGRAEARRMGELFSQLHIAISDVHTSPYCRCVETGQLAFGQAIKTKDLIYSLGLEPAQRNRLATALKQMLATAPPAGKNAVLVGHTSNLKEAAGIWPKNEGDAIIFQPDGQGGFSFVARMTTSDWEIAAKAQPAEGIPAP